MTTYPHERQIEYWVSRAIEDYFGNQGYDVVVLPNTQTAENQIPYDHLFAGTGVKVFGFQYKRLKNGAKDYWSIDIAQFRQLSNYGWIYYALPEITSVRQRRNALHLIAIIKSTSLRNKIGTAVNGERRLLQSEIRGGLLYYRWGGFVQGLFSCKLGWRPSSPDELRSVFRDSAGTLSSLTDIYIVPLDVRDTRLAIRISPFMTDIRDDNFDFGIELR
ncbi:MAG: hypothetical protein PHU08_04360 [Dehalococcoidales bacterium]|nr:hypothetical protein [Dehalococcoidales bacterium]